MKPPEMGDHSGVFFEIRIMKVPYRKLYHDISKLEDTKFPP